MPRACPPCLAGIHTCCRQRIADLNGGWTPCACEAAVCTARREAS